jgi:hypothetical protein
MGMVLTMAAKVPKGVTQKTYDLYTKRGYCLWCTVFVRVSQFTERASRKQSKRVQKLRIEIVLPLRKKPRARLRNHTVLAWQSDKKIRPIVCTKLMARKAPFTRSGTIIVVFGA